MDVDIIYMSWTIKKKGTYPDEQDMESVEHAVGLNTSIPFGSLRDKDPTHKPSDYAPVGLNGVIKIGSVIIFGQQSRMNLYAILDISYQVRIWRPRLGTSSAEAPWLECQCVQSHILKSNHESAKRFGEPEKLIG